MTLSLARGTNKSKVSANQESFYAQWRVRSGVVSILREDRDSPPERLLQAIWQHQRLLRDRLATPDGQAVRVLHPGFASVEGGPDFRDAVIQFGEEPARTGDVEVDLRASGWRAHGHDRNPNFRNVILHVIWEGERRAEDGPPIIVLRRVLDAPLGELSLWLGSEAAPGFPAEQRGQCCAPLRRLTGSQIVELLHQAAHIRLRSKAAQFQARARQVGWEQALWEGTFRALGYKHNTWPMQRLGELRPRWSLSSDTPEVTSAHEGPTHSTHGGQNHLLLRVQARLLGLSGLLPQDLTRNEHSNDSYLRGVWDQWWRDRDEFSDAILPKLAWRLHGLRPANHPHRRLALAAAWSLAGSLGARLERWCEKEWAEKDLATSLLQALQVDSDSFWSWHWTLNSSCFRKEQPLLGTTRLTDLAINVVLPWLWIRAVEGANAAMQRRLEERYFQWPAAEDNSVLRLARERLLSGAACRSVPGAAAQQGLIQIVRDFCDHSNAICENCKMPTLVAEFTRSERLTR